MRTSPAPTPSNPESGGLSSIAPPPPPGATPLKALLFACFGYQDPQLRAGLGVEDPFQAQGAEPLILGSQPEAMGRARNSNCPRGPGAAQARIGAWDRPLSAAQRFCSIAGRCWASGHCWALGPSQVEAAEKAELGKAGALIFF